jgi:hypothetical protein
MRYFKLTAHAGVITEYIEVSDDTTELKTKLDTTIVEEIDEDEYNAAVNTGSVVSMPIHRA